VWLAIACMHCCPTRVACTLPLPCLKPYNTMPCVQAARYQIAIMCAIGGATALAATSATFFAARQLVDRWAGGWGARDAQAMPPQRLCDLRELLG
jgi:hypothetical protein